MKKENKRLNEEQLKILSCALAVGVMILLLSGDYIITKFIKTEPNNNYVLNKKEDEQQKEETESTLNQNNNYDVSFLTPITIEEALTKIKAKERVIIFSGRSTCGPCQMFVPVLKKALEELSITDVYYFDRNKINNQTPGYEEFIKYNSILQERFGSTPFLMMFNNGSWQDYILGMMPEEETLKETIKNKINNLK